MRHRVNSASREIQASGRALKGTSALASLALAVTAGTSADANAQAAVNEDAPDSGIINEIVVTAQKRAERLRDIPQSVSALTSETMEVRGIASADDLGRQTPGLVLNRRQDNSPNVVIRGVGSFGNTQGVGFYVDDVQTFTDQTMRLQDLERVEILKGPQGTLYGGSNIGGAIKYVSKKPDLDRFAADVSLEGGSRDFLDVYGSMNAPLSDIAAVRVSGYRTHDDGYIKNNLLGIDAAELTEWGGRVQLLLQPTDDFRALLTLRHRNLDGGSQNYSPQNSIDDPLFASNTNVASFQERESSSVVLDLENDFGAVTLTSISSYTDLQVRSVQDVDYGPIPQTRSEALDPRPSKVYTQELRLTSPAGQRLDWLGGVYFARQDNINGLSAPFSFFAGPFAIVPALDFTTRQEDLAAFVTSNLHLGEFTITGGLRWLDTQYTYRGLVRSPLYGADADRIENADQALLPRLSLSYKTGGDALLYATASRGYEPGKVTILSDPPFPYDPETTWAYEVGVKGDLGSQINYEVAVFYTNYEDRQVETRFFDPAVGTVERINNIGESSAKGVELNAIWSPLTQLDLSLAAAYTDAKWTDAVFGVDDGTGTGGVTNLRLDGDRVPNAPELTFNVAGDYRLPMFKNDQLTFHLDAGYTSEVRFRLVNSGPSTFTPSYWLVNARIGFGPETGEWEVAARVENLFDEFYFNEFAAQVFGTQNADGTCDACHLGAPASPRRYLVSVRRSF